MTTDSPDFAVVVCTRNRPSMLPRTLDALAAQTDPGFPVVIVDQSDADAADPTAPPALADRMTVVRDHGRGLSRARNVGLRATGAPWVIYVDDDCLPEPEWAAAMRREFARHPDASIISGHVGADRAPIDDDLEVTLFPVAHETRRAGRFTNPGRVAFGVCFAVRRDAAERLGGWDERLGPGVPVFPAADDMDFNYRLLRSGAVAWASPAPRAVHVQWRNPAQLAVLQRGYLAAWSGFALKHLRTGDRVGGGWLWLFGVRDVAHMFFEAARRRSRLHLAVARGMLAGLLEGTRNGLAQRW